MLTQIWIPFYLNIIIYCRFNTNTLWIIYLFEECSRVRWFVHFVVYVQHNVACWWQKNIRGNFNFKIKVEVCGTTPFMVVSRLSLFIRDVPVCVKQRSTNYPKLCFPSLTATSPSPPSFPYPLHFRRLLSLAIPLKSPRLQSFFLLSLRWHPSRLPGLATPRPQHQVQGETVSDILNCC